MATEVWRPIPDFNGYEASNYGQVRSFKKRQGLYWIIADRPQRILKPGSRNGYQMVQLSRGDATFQACSVAGLVLKAFVGPRPKGIEVCHNDCNRVNNRLDNLRYDTPRGNCRDGYGKDSGRLTNKQVAELRNLAAQGISDEILANMFNVSMLTVRLCRRGRTYKYVRGPLTKRKTGPKGGCSLTNQEIKQMRREAQQEDRSIARLGRRYGISESNVSLILRGLRRRGAGGPILPSHNKNGKSAA